MRRNIHLPEGLGNEEISPHVAEPHGIVGINSDLQGTTRHTKYIGPLTLWAGMICEMNVRSGHPPPNRGAARDKRMLQRSRRPGQTGAPWSIYHRIPPIRATKFPCRSKKGDFTLGGMDEITFYWV